MYVQHVHVEERGFPVTAQRPCPLIIIVHAILTIAACARPWLIEHIRTMNNS